MYVKTLETYQCITCPQENPRDRHEVPRHQGNEDIANCNQKNRDKENFDCSEDRILEYLKQVRKINSMVVDGQHTSVEGSIFSDSITFFFGSGLK